VAYIFNPKLTVHELLQTVCEEFHIPCRRPRRARSRSRTTSTRSTPSCCSSHAAGQSSVLIIDEAQNLSADVLEQLRLLTNLETSERKLLQIVLIGQPELRDMLARPELEQLAQRVIARYHLEALTRAPRPRSTSPTGWPWPGCAALPFRRRGALRPSPLLARGVPRPHQPAVRPRPAGRLATPAPAPWWTRRRPRCSGRTPVPRRPLAAWPAGRLIARQRGERVAGRPAPRHPDRLAPAGLGLAAARHGRRAPCQARHAAATAAQQLLCYRAVNLSLPLIRQLGRPGILTLQRGDEPPVYAVLTGLNEQTATFQVDGQARTVPLLALGTLWRGDFATFWRPPPGYTGELADRAGGPTVDWIARRLSRIDGAPLPPASGVILDPALKARLQAFQRAHGPARRRAPRPADPDAAQPRHRRGRTPPGHRIPISPCPTSSMPSSAPMPNAAAARCPA
jgi:general secretion pathway protein A